MKVLIVCAHQDERSLNGGLLAQALKTFDQMGCDVRVSDLHAMEFDPIARASDFVDHAPGERLDYYAEQKRAYLAGSLAPDIIAEVEKIAWCDLLILQFPLYWFSMPAIMKGWVDRVFVPGFAFGGGKWYEKGGLVGKRAMVATTMAAYPHMMAADGLNGVLDVNLWPIHNGILAFCGFEVLPPFVVNAAPYLDEEQGRAAIAAYGARLNGIAHETPMEFHRRDEFDKQWKMRADVTPRTVGHAFARQERGLPQLIDNYALAETYNATRT